MSKTNLIICFLAILGIISLSNIKQSCLSASFVGQNPIEDSSIFINKNRQQNLTPGILVCNDEESKCLKFEKSKVSFSSILFSIFQKNSEDEVNLLACKNCH